MGHRSPLVIKHKNQWSYWAIRRRINDRLKQNKLRSRNDSSRKKGGLRKKQSPPLSKAQPQIGQAIKERETRKWSRTNRPTTVDT